MFYIRYRNSKYVFEIRSVHMSRNWSMLVWSHASLELTILPRQGNTARLMNKETISWSGFELELCVCALFIFILESWNLLKIVNTVSSCAYNEKGSTVKVTDCYIL